jgi:general secretion pathway protein D
MAFSSKIAMLVIVGLSPLSITAQTANVPTTDTTKTSEPSLNARKIHEAANAYVAGARLLDRGNLAAAEDQFIKAATLNPENPDYLQAATLAHEHRVTDLVQQAGKARVLGQTQKSQELLSEARKLDPENIIVTQHTDPVAAISSFHPEIRASLDSPSATWIREVSALIANTWHPKLRRPCRHSANDSASPVTVWYPHGL